MLISQSRSMAIDVVVRYNKHEPASSKRRKLPCLIIRSGVSAHHHQAEASRSGAQGLAFVVSIQPQSLSPDSPQSLIAFAERSGLIDLVGVFKSMVYNIAAVPSNDDHTAHLHSVPSIPYPALKTCQATIRDHGDQTPNHDHH